MTIDDETVTVIRDLLQREARVDERRIDLAVEAEALVLRGAVATPEEATAAALLAEQHADRVRNELRVDPGQRDTADTAPDAVPGAEALRGSSAGRELPRNEELSVQTSGFGPETLDDGTVTEVDQALAENVPWDPPDAPHLAPTSAEQRGVVAHDQSVEPPAEAGAVEADDDEAPSAADLSQAELAEAARPDEEASHGS